MASIIEHETPHYAWHYDSAYGVGCFVRKSDGAASFLETGTDCQNVRRDLRRLAQKTGSPRYPVSAPGFAAIMDSIASEYTFVPVR